MSHGEPGSKAAIPPSPMEQTHDLRAVLRVAEFRTLWRALGLSSLGDWLGLLALTALAARLADGGYATQAYAVSYVFVLRLVPALLLGPVAGLLADRLDRRLTMAACDLVRFALFLSVPLVGRFDWLLAVAGITEVASLLWTPAHDAGVPHLVPRARLAAAAQLNLVTAYGAAPVAAAVFTVLALVCNGLVAAVPGFADHREDLAFYLVALAFLLSALMVARLAPGARDGDEVVTRPRRAPWRTVRDGWSFVARTGVVRGLVVGILGVFAAGGAVVGVATRYTRDLGGGDAGYGVLFGAIFLGLASGMFVGPRLLPGFSRRRLFGLAIVCGAAALVTVALVPNLVIVVIGTAALGACAGVVWVTGYTLLGLEADSAERSRTLAFVQTLVRVTLLVFLAAAPAVAGAIGPHQWRIGHGELNYSGAAATLLAAGIVLAGIGMLAYRQMDDRRGVRLGTDLRDAVRAEAVVAGRPGNAGFFLVFEGGEGAGKSTQIERIADWIRAKGHPVVVTREPGATKLGGRLRDMLLSRDTGAITPRAEALLYAADRAEHVRSVIRPALQGGAIVISDRYVDSSIAYQGAGRDLAPREVARISRWATDGLVPDLTVLLDVPPRVGLERAGADPDRLESEPVAFHEKVRRAFLELAADETDRYLVVDATKEVDVVTTLIRHRLDRELPLSSQEIRQGLEREQREREEAEKRRIAEATREAEKQALVERLKLEAEQRKADRERAAEQERARLEAERRAEEEKRRLAEAARRAEYERIMAEDERRKAEAAAARRAEEQRRAVEEAARRAEEAAARATQEAQRRAEAKLRAEEAVRRAQQEQRAEAEAAAARADQAARRLAEERSAKERSAEAAKPRPADPAGSDGKSVDGTSANPADAAADGPSGDRPSGDGDGDGSAGRGGSDGQAEHGGGLTARLPAATAQFPAVVDPTEPLTVVRLPEETRQLPRFDGERDTAPAAGPPAAGDASADYGAPSLLDELLGPRGASGASGGRSRSAGGRPEGTGTGGST